MCASLHSTKAWLLDRCVMIFGVWMPWWFCTTAQGVPRCGLSCEAGCLDGDYRWLVNIPECMNTMTGALIVNRRCSALSSKANPTNFHVSVERTIKQERRGSGSRSYKEKGKSRIYKICLKMKFGQYNCNRNGNRLGSHGYTFREYWTFGRWYPWAVSVQGLLNWLLCDLHMKTHHLLYQSV